MFSGELTSTIVLDGTPVRTAWRSCVVELEGLADQPLVVAVDHRAVELPQLDAHDAGLQQARADRPVELREGGLVAVHDPVAQAGLHDELDLVVRQRRRVRHALLERGVVQDHDTDQREQRHHHEPAERELRERDPRRERLPAGATTPAAARGVGGRSRGGRSGRRRLSGIGGLDDVAVAARAVAETSPTSSTRPTTHPEVPVRRPRTEDARMSTRYAERRPCGTVRRRRRSSERWWRSTASCTERVCGVGSTPRSLTSRLRSDW